MVTIHWLDEAAVAETESVCSVDFADEGMAIDFAHNLYRSVHAYGRSKLGFAIKSEGRCVYAWRWDSGPTRIRDVENARTPQAAARASEVLDASNVAAPCLAPQADGPARGRFRPAGSGSALLGRLKRVGRWRPEIDHYLLAIIAVLAILCGSPLCSIYATVQDLMRDETSLHQQRSLVALATRDATKSVLATDGKVDFRKLFWHLRVVGPTEIHLLAYEPNDGEGPRLIFETKNLLHWHLRRVRGADGTWWASRSVATNLS